MLVHAVQMVRKNAKNYALLSITVVLSFSGLLAYLMYTDSSLYNRYKEILSRDTHVIYVVDTSDVLSREQALLEVLNREGLEASYIRQTLGARTTVINESHTVGNYIYVIPSHVWGLYRDGYTKSYPVTWLDDREDKDIYLGLNEILISRNLYQLLGMEQKDEPTYELWLSSDGATNTAFPVECRVVGLLEEIEDIDWTPSQDGILFAGFNIYISQATVEAAAGNAEPDYGIRSLLLYVDNPASAEQRIEQLGLDYISTYSMQMDAIKELQLHSQTKAMITLALFVLLAINLYGCFMNTLEYRKFEVGVKRAIGASGGAIMGQFLCEGILVMLFNLILSIVLVVDGFLVYKYIYQKNSWLTWTITLSSASAGMFAGVSICLTLLFSALFAYKSTQVEVVKQLKAE